MTNKLSIIIPIYNEAPYLKRCLDSIKLRDDVQLVIVDDASTDGSLKIEFDYQANTKGNVRLSALANHQGVAHARNDGLDLAEGEFVTFLDADDALVEDGVDNMLKAITRHPDDNVIQLNHKRCNSDGCTLQPRFWARAGFYDITRTTLPPKWAPVWNKIYNKRFLDANGVRFPHGQQYDEDRRFNIACLRHTGGIVCDEAVALCKYFDNSASICHTINRDKMLGAIYGLTDELRNENDPEIIEVIRQSLMMHLNSNKFNQTFGG